MPESHNVELAHQLTESEHDQSDHARARHRLVEFAEVAILAIVAIATAWSGFQASEFDGEQSRLYGEASRLRFEAEEQSTLAGQELTADSGMFTAWLQAHSSGDATLATEMERRFTPDYHRAFEAWLASDPFENPDAAPGPAAMPEYRNPHRARAVAINARASDTFQEGTDARKTAGKYVRATVLFASVLFLVALGQRFGSHGARIGVNVIAGLLLVFTVASVIGLPRA